MYVLCENDGQKKKNQIFSFVSLKADHRYCIRQKKVIAYREHQVHGNISGRH